jgi:hypothetical protein
MIIVLAFLTSHKRFRSFISPTCLAVRPFFLAHSLFWLLLTRFKQSYRSAEQAHLVAHARRSDCRGSLLTRIVGLVRCFRHERTYAMVEEIPEGGGAAKGPSPEVAEVSAPSQEIILRSDKRKWDVNRTGHEIDCGGK